MAGVNTSAWQRRAALAMRLWRFVPLAVALAAASFFARRRLPPAPCPEVPDTQPGVSVIIPERGTPDLLAETLDALSAALAEIDEPQQVIVVVNGAEKT